ncbi:universal stress protein [Phaeovulum sp.]|uniref:universal stress protein n=1 Tax=Phaeovulum sp. TaxID=2934796 RepID=UPI0035622267
MSYKSIFTIVTDSALAASQIDIAVAVARREDAHLEVLCLGVDRTQTGYYYAGATAFIHQETIERAEEEAKTAEAWVRERLEPEDLRWSAESAVAQLGAIGSLIGARARFADLVVLAKPYGEGRTQDAESIIEAALFDSQAPVMVIPDHVKELGAMRRIVVAWNQSTEALTAVRAALPILRAADLVDITIIDPPSHGPERSDPGGQLSQMLARHGIKAEVSVLARTMPRVSDVINRHVRESNADMVVMGAYGHSRFREAILGGATRHMLEMAEVPVFMSH